MLETNIWNVITDYYITSPVWLLLTALSLVYIFIRSGIKKKILLTLFFFVLTIFNEVSYHFLTQKIVDAASYYRFLWILPYGLAVAYAVLQLVMDLRGTVSADSGSGAEKKRKKTAALFFFCMLIVGVLFITQGNYLRRLKDDLPQNKYLVSDDVLQIKWLLDQEREKGQAEEIPTLACDKTMMLQYQTIDAGSVIATNRTVYLNYREYGNEMPGYYDKYLLSTICEDNAQPDIMQAKAAVIREEIDYIIVHAGAGMENYMESLDCSLVGSTNSYLLYRVKYNYYKAVDDPQETADILEQTGIKLRDIVISLSGNSVADIPEDGNCVAQTGDVIGQYLLLNDLHTFLTTDSIAPEYEKTVQDRYANWALTETGLHSTDAWQVLSAVLDSYHSDGILMAGDMIDFASATNYDLFQRGLSKIQTPILYARADHDIAEWWNADGAYTKEDGEAAQKALYSGNVTEENKTGTLEPEEDIMLWEKDEYLIVAWNQSTSQMTEDGLKKAKEAFGKGKPVILLTHVPIAPSTDDGLARASLEYRNNINIWTVGGQYIPNETTQEFIDMVLAEDSPVCAVLCGHLHFRYEAQLNGHCVEYVFDPSYLGNMVRVSIVQ